MHCLWAEISELLRIRKESYCNVKLMWQDTGQSLTHCTHYLIWTDFLYLFHSYVFPRVFGTLLVMPKPFDLKLDNFTLKFLFGGVFFRFAFLLNYELNITYITCSKKSETLRLSAWQFRLSTLIIKLKISRFAIQELRD